MHSKLWVEFCIKLPCRACRLHARTQPPLLAAARWLKLSNMVPCPPAPSSISLDGASSHVCGPDAIDLNDLEDDDNPASDGSNLAKQQRTLSRMKARKQNT